uniref:glycine-rich domain-containing protein n=1 Tax=Flavobacterium sp. TaxID=239 RepID=UPI0037BFC00D
MTDLISVGSNGLNTTARWQQSHYYDSIFDYSINSNYYIDYDFKNSNLLTIDSSPNYKHLTSYGAKYALNSNLNSLYLQNSNYVTIPENNWLSFSNLTISGWFKTESFQTNDEILDFTYQYIDHPVTVPSIQPTWISSNDYFYAFTNTAATSNIIFSRSTKCDILIIGGGGGGGGDIGGGGGSGGVVYQKGVTLAAGTYTITVGAGGAVRAASAVNTRNSVDGNDGSLSRIQLSGSTLVINGVTFQGSGGGGGANYNANVPTNGRAGGSGGGGTNKDDDTVTIGGTANQGITLFNGITNVPGGYDGFS